MNTEDIKIFGDHDEATLAQIKRSAAHEAVVGAVLCADGHKGYGVPIGGVLAYDGHISPSAVGYDIGCFVGEESVTLTDGREITFTELALEQVNGNVHFGFAIDRGHKVVVAPLLNARQTGTSEVIVSVEIDNGRTIRCTPDHIFYHRDGSEVEAQNLTEGQSLMPLYIRPYSEVNWEKRSFRNKRMKLEDYLGVYNPSNGMWDLVHHLADEYNLAWGNDSRPNGVIRHHVDFNKLNNDPPNIRRMGWKEHFTLHSNMASERAKRSEIGFGKAYRLHPELFLRLGSKNMTELHKKPDFAERRDERALRHLEIMLSSEGCKENWSQAGQRGRNGLIDYNQSEAGREQSKQTRKLPCKCSRCGGEFPNHSAVIKHYHQEHRGVVNHKVVCVKTEILSHPVPVFCVTVPEHHNFALSCGVFVHNCGNKACRLDISADEVRTNIKSIMDDVWRTLDFGAGRKNSNDGPTDHPLFDSDLWHGPLLKPLKQMAQGQLGTIGSGNHYVDLFSDEKGRAWVGVHFGSRGLGHKTATHFLKAGGASDSMDAEPLVLSMDSDLGQDYYAHMVLAGRYAYAGRDWVCDKVASLLGAQVVESVHNHHNFGWTETHSGREVMVVRKGATPAFAGQRGFVGGSMGDCSVILEGMASGEASAALHSTVHGAGRAMSRTQARGKTNYKTKQVIAPGLVSREMMMEWIGKLGVELRGAGTDESPQAYKRLPDVLGFHQASVRVLHTLTPLGVAMAGENEHDPFKD